MDGVEGDVDDVADGGEDEGLLTIPFPVLSDPPTVEGLKRRAKEAPAKAKAEAKRRQAVLNSFFGASPLKKFSARLRREGTFNEYKERIKELINSGQSISGAAKQAREEYGYQGAKHENELLEREIALLRMSETEQRQSENQRKYRARKKEETFDEVVAQLPQTASLDVEMAWVGAHPAMMRRERMQPAEDGSLPRIVLDVKDVMEMNGRAPSKRAVVSLQNWVNKANAFSAKMMDEAKKHTASAVGVTKDGKSADEVIADKRMSDVERLMDQLETKDANGQVLP